MPKSIAIAFALGLASSSAFAGECASGSPAGSAAPEQRQASAGNGQPAAAASDGVGATGWTGGTGGNLATYKAQGYDVADVPRPTDRIFTLSTFFQDYLRKNRIKDFFTSNGVVRPTKKRDLLFPGFR